MVSIAKLIGSRVERIFSEEFGGFEFTDTKRTGRVPDFFNSKYGFWVEVKASYSQRDYGARVKKYQIDSFDKLDEPVVYFFGFHDFSNATRKLAGLRERHQIEVLNRRLNLLSGYFVSADLVKSIWEKEKRISKKDNFLYCVLRQAFLENVILERTFGRGGKTVFPSKYYEYNPDNFVFKPLKVNDLSFPVGFALNVHNGRNVLHYLASNEFV